MAADHTLHVPSHLDVDFTGFFFFFACVSRLNGTASVPACAPLPVFTLIAVLREESKLDAFFAFFKWRGK